MRLNRSGDDRENGDTDVYTTTSNTGGDPINIGPGDVEFVIRKAPDGGCCGTWQLQSWNVKDANRIVAQSSRSQWLGDTGNNYDYSDQKHRRP